MSLVYTFLMMKNIFLLFALTVWGHIKIFKIAPNKPMVFSFKKETQHVLVLSVSRKQQTQHKNVLNPITPLKVIPAVARPVQLILFSNLAFNDLIKALLKPHIKPGSRKYQQKRDCSLYWHWNKGTRGTTNKSKINEGLENSLWGFCQRKRRLTWDLFCLEN